MWTDVKYCVPLIDGRYVVQNVFGEVTSMGYTLEGGWNTSRNDDGTISDRYAMNNGYVVRWYVVEQPPEVPDEWYKEYLERSK